ncbi:transporter substrate-binding domain-containing protein [Pseudomonas hunanensis]|uniref:ABC transporter substrate-binding protein n=1 Tax=Pseudomonas hunanensis TaxID=1247546 RepID=A0ACC9MWA2_9PSED|nr:transporter substrate-binding domain-containing protein [Pseudomonas hunanensis]PKF23296.1 ABC transporter substrate-binding protein [Pseudomonas hunanensis]
MGQGGIFFLKRPYLVAAIFLVLLTSVLAVSVLEIGGEDALTRYQHGLPLRVGYALEAPFVMLDADGDVTGEAPEVLRHVLRTMGLERVVWLHGDFGSLIRELENGRIDIIAAGMFVTAERRERVLFSRPTAFIRPGLLVRRGNPLHLLSLADFSSQPGARLAVIDGSIEQQQASSVGVSERRIKPFPDEVSAVAAIRAGQADGLLLSAVSLRYLIDRDDAAAFDLVVAQAEQAPGAPAFAFRRQDSRLHEQVDQALASFIGSAKHLQLVEKFGFVASDLPRATEESQR